MALEQACSDSDDDEQSCSDSEDEIIVNPEEQRVLIEEEPVLYLDKNTQTCTEVSLY